MAACQAAWAAAWAAWAAWISNPAKPVFCYGKGGSRAALFFLGLIGVSTGRPEPEVHELALSRKSMLQTAWSPQSPRLGAPPPTF